MPPCGRAVLLVDAKDRIARASFAGPLAEAAERDLRAAGHTVVRVDARRIGEDARRWNPAAVVLPVAVTSAAWRRWQADPALRPVPIVVLARRAADELLFPWPLGALVRGDAFLSAKDLARPGAVADAVRAAGAERRRTLGAGEVAGERLWYAGSALFIFALLLAGLGIVLEALAHRPPRLILVAGCALGLGKVMMSAGGAAALGGGARLRAHDWVTIGFVAVIAWVLAVQ